MSTPAPLPSLPVRRRATGRDFLRWIGALLAGAGLTLSLSAWLAGPDRWWSAFIFLPSYILIGLALIHRRAGGPLSHWSVRTNLGMGVIVLTVAVIFALGMDWRYAWTMMLIVPGFVLAVNGFTQAPRGSTGFAIGAWITAIGLALAALGLVFLGQQLGAYNLAAIFGDFAWWALFIALPGLVAVRFAWLARSQRAFGAGGTTLMVIGCLHVAAALNEFLHLAWYWELPVLVAAAGAGLLLSAGRRMEARQTAR